MRSEQSAELVCGHADNGQDVPQRSPGNVLARMNGHRHGPSVGVLHHMVAAVNALDSESGVP